MKNIFYCILFFSLKGFTQLNDFKKIYKQDRKIYSIKDVQKIQNEDKIIGKELKYYLEVINIKTKTKFILQIISSCQMGYQILSCRELDMNNVYQEDINDVNLELEILGNGIQYVIEKICIDFEKY